MTEEMQMVCASVTGRLIWEAMARLILQRVYRELYTPWGLRSLSLYDAQFHPLYGGIQFKRDMVYHQGTVWAFPLGAFYKAWIRFALDISLKFMTDLNQMNPEVVLRKPGVLAKY